MAPPYNRAMQLRSLPSVDRVVGDPRLADAPHDLAVAAARVALDQARDAIRAGTTPATWSS